jgi:hypothetical protein
LPFLTFSASFFASPTSTLRLASSTSDSIAHPENASGHALGMKERQAVGLRSRPRI